MCDFHVVPWATPLPASPTRGEVSGRAGGMVERQSLPGTLPLVGRDGEGVAQNAISSIIMLTYRP
jgi:hypothetical protein